MTRLRPLAPELQPVGADVETLLATPELVEQMPVEGLLPLLDRCAVDHDRITAVERLARARLHRELPTLLRANEPLLSADEAGRRLRVSVDYVRDHGEALGIAVPLGGLTRYDPVSVDAIRRRRSRDT